MEGSSKFWKVQNKTLLLLSLMNELAGDAHISFEGDLKGLRLLTMLGASQEPTATLKRNTVSPSQDFVIVPLGPSTGREIMNALSGTVPRSVIHIQIEKDGALQFGAYDNFHPECIYFGGAVRQGVIDGLVSARIMKPHRAER